MKVNKSFTNNILQYTMLFEAFFCLFSCSSVGSWSTYQENDLTSKYSKHALYAKVVDQAVLKCDITLM